MSALSHIHEKIDFTAEVFNEAAAREVKEEVGLDVILADDRRMFRREEPDYRELIPPQFLNRHRVSDAHEHITLTYFARADTDKVVVSDNHEKSDEIKWFTRDELEENAHGIPDTIRHYALRALEELSIKE